MKISIIIPVLNEAQALPLYLNQLQHLRAKGHEVILVDGGSDDNSCQLAEGMVDSFHKCERGRARQMNSGVGHATGQLLLFLHADTQLPKNVDMMLASTVYSDRAWGWFDVRLSGSHVLLRVIEWFMNIRSRMTGVATGDQAIFITTELFKEVNGFPEIELMEDISISKKLRRVCWPITVSGKVTTSSRRWEDNGIFRTVLKMWGIRLRYFLGTKPSTLAGLYEKR